MATVHTKHRREDGEQRTTKRVELEDATGETIVHEFEGPPGGPYEHVDDSPTDAALRALAEHLDDGADAIGHDVPTEGK